MNRIPDSLKEEKYNRLREFLKKEDITTINAVVMACNAYMICLVLLNMKDGDTRRKKMRDLCELNPNTYYLLETVENMAKCIAIFSSDLDETAGE